MKKRGTFFWLIPARPEADLFRDIIRILAMQFDAPVFEPHLTIGEAGEISPALQTLRQTRFGPIRLRITGIKQSPKFTQTLIVQFAPNRALDRLVNDLSGLNSLPNPHVSLMYKTMPAATRRSLARAVQFPFRHVVFDQVKAMSCVTPTKTKRDVESWRVLATRRSVR